MIIMSGENNKDKKEVFDLLKDEYFCFSEYCDDVEIPDEIKKEFTPIYKGDEWIISPSCTQCNDAILF